MLEPEPVTDQTRADAAPDASLNLSINDLAEVAAASKQLEKYLLARGVPDAEAMNMRIAIAEGLNNAVEHTPGAEQIRLEARLEGNTFSATISDHSSGFELPVASDLPDETFERGRGLFLIRAIMDTLNYFRDPEGNRLVMTRKIR